jgi:type II secretory pathway component GspD/PulD (secretin)
MKIKTRFLFLSLAAVFCIGSASLVSAQQELFKAPTAKKAVGLKPEAVAKEEVVASDTAKEEPAQKTESAAPAAAEAKKEGAGEVSLETAPAETALEKDRIPGGIDGFISLDLRDIDIVEALKFLSRKAALDIVATKNVAGRVTLMVESVPVKDVFDIMLRSNKLAYDKTGKIFNVMTQEEYKALYGRVFADTREVATFRLRYTIPEQAFSLLDTLKSEIGRILVDPESGNVLVLDIPDKIKDMAKALDVFDRKNEVRIFPLQYAKAKEVEEQLKNQLDSKKVGLIKADERSNQVIVQTLPDRMNEIERLIGELDSKTKEVIIDVTIIKIKLTDEETKGFQWEGLFDAGRKRGLFYMGSTPFATVNPKTDAGYFTSRQETWYAEGKKVGGGFPFSGTTSSLSSSLPKIGTEALHIGMVSAQDFDTVINYIQTLGDTKILSNPKLVVTNNQESRIHVGEKQAYVTTTTTTGQVTSTVAENVTFVDIGTQLAVTPVINDDGYVTMKVKAEISSVAETLITPMQNKIPIIDTSLAETTVMVKEGTTIIIGGLKKDEKSDTTKQTPFLGKIPFLGNLFKSGTKTVDHTELIIMLTPRIITGDVLVTGAGQKVEHSGIKERQDYKDLKSAPRPASVSGVEPSLSDKKVVFKGMRVAE